LFEKVCIILLVNLCFYLKCLGFKYVSDDIPSANRKETHPKWKYWLLVLEGHLKSNPVIDHAITIVLHSLVCAFIYIGFGANDVSFLAALLFSFNPINNQGSVWISGRGYVLSTLGMVGAMSMPLLAPAWILLACYSNAGFLAPLVFLGSDYSWFLLFMPLIWGFYWKRFKNNVQNKISQEMYTEDRKIHISKLILFIKTASFYFIHSIIPIKTTFYHSYMQSMAGAGKEKAYSLRDRFFWLGLVIFGWMIWYWTTQPWTMASFGLLWWLITLAPFCNLFRLQQEIAERYCYLPNAGLMVALASFLLASPIWSAVFITMYATKMWFWMDAFQDDYYTVEASCIASPNSWFVWHVRAMKRWGDQSYQEALIMWTMARLISPKEFKILFNIASALKLGKHDKEAEQFIKQAEENIPAGQEKQANELIEGWKKGNIVVLL